MTSSTPLVLYHGPGCADGFASAWVAHLAIPDAELVPVNYGEAPPDVRGRDVYVLDFSYKAAVMAEMARRARRLVVLDHHATAQDELAGILTEIPEMHHMPSFTMGPEASRDYFVGDGAVYGKFDMSHSGAMLAWMYFFPQQLPPILVQYVEDRDLWKFELPWSREVSAAIRSYPFDLALWDSWHNLNMPGHPVCIRPGILSAFFTEGAAILRAEGELVERICAHAHDMTFDDGVERYAIRVANTPVLQSEVAGRLAKDSPFGAVWYDNGYTRRWSLRSTKESGTDVGLIAKRMGGGGHPQAAGFEEVSCTVEHSPHPPGDT